MSDAGWPGRTAVVMVAIAFVSGCGDDGARTTETPRTSPVVTQIATPVMGTTAEATVPVGPANATSNTEVTAAATSAPARAASLCDLSIADALPGAVASPDLIEISGIAASRTQEVIWAHNDSGDTARIFAVGLDGSALATYTLNGAEATDWEDMAIGPGPEDGTDYVYLGDIGDNASIRPQITVYRAREPKLDPAASSLTVNAEAIVLTYPDGAHDAETLLVDPVSGDLFVVTKDITGGPSGVYRAANPLGAGAPITLARVADIGFGALTPSREIPGEAGPLPTALGKVPTGGDISPDGSAIAIRTYGTVWLWQREPGTALADAFAAAPCEGPSAIEPQGEAIAFSATGSGYFTASEGANPPLHEFRQQ